MSVTTKKLAEELEEIKISLNFMSEEISKVVKQQVNLMGLMEEVRELKATVKQRDQKIQLLEQRIDDLEQYSRADNVTITGLETKHHGYSRRPTRIIRLVRFTNRKHKIDVLKQSKNLKGTGVYMNEHLTRKNAEIARNGRMLRKQNKIQATWTRNGKVFIKLNGPPEQAKVFVVRDLQDLDQYK
ncbi:hypothetical protein ABVT39_011735 [Epinephelus coioides]